MVGIWLLGLIVLGAVLEFDRRVDETRRAQVVIAQMRNQQGALIQVAFDPAVAGKNDAPARAETKIRLAGAKKVLDGSVATLASLGHSHEPARIKLLTNRYYALADRLSLLVANNASGQAALELGASQRPGGVQAELNQAFDRADLDYRAEAARSRNVAKVGTIAAVFSLLLAFSFAFHRSVRERRLSDHEATTDALTGLGNRRKLFADMERKIGSLGPDAGGDDRDLRSGRLQGLQRQLRASGGRRPSHQAGIPARSRGRRSRQRLPNRGRRIRHCHRFGLRRRG